MPKIEKAKIAVICAFIISVLSVGVVHAAVTNDYNLRTASAGQNGQQTPTTDTRSALFKVVCPSGTSTVTNTYTTTLKWASAPSSSLFSNKIGSKYQINASIAKTSGNGPQSVAMNASYGITDVPSNYRGFGSNSTQYVVLPLSFKVTIPAGMRFTSYDITKGCTKTSSGGTSAVDWEVSTSSSHSASANVEWDTSKLCNNTAAAKTVTVYWNTHVSNVGMATLYDYATSKHCWLYTGTRKPEFTMNYARNTYTVKYNANGGEGTTADSSHSYGLEGNLSQNGFTKIGHAFTGWNTAADGSGTSYTSGQTVSNLTATHGATINLYAQWEPCDYTISYTGLREGDNTGTLPTRANFSESITIPNPKRSGASFRGWNITGMDGCEHFYGAKKTTSTELSGIRATSFKNLREGEGEVNFEAVWIEATGEAYAVLDSSGKFTFFRSENEYENDTTGNNFQDIDGNSYSGTVFAGFESLSEDGEYNVPWIDYMGNIKEVTMTQSVFPLDISWWFYGAGELLEADLSKIVPADLTKMQGTFSGDSKLKKLNIKSFTSQQVTTMDGMVKGLTALKRICLGDKFRFTKTARDEVVPTKIQEAYAEFDSDTGVLRFFRDDRGKYTHNQVDDTKTYYTGVETTYPDSPSYTSPWHNCRTSVRTIVFEDSIKPKSTYDWFYNMGGLTEIVGLEKLDTSNVTTMSRMFYGCWKLTTLDVSHFDTSKVTDMSYMFFDCNRLPALDVSHFDTSKVTDMSYMFCTCNNLTATLNVMRMPSSYRYSNMCASAACDSGQVTLKYISPVTSANIDTLVATKGDGNVINGGQGTFIPPTPPVPLD